MRYNLPLNIGPFGKWLIDDQENRRLLLWILIVTQCQFVVFSIFYPLPNFISPDSYSYLKAAFDNQDINMWAIGYSKFLRLFSCITPSAHALVWFQYSLLAGSISYLLLTLKYFFRISKWVFRILATVSLLNPLIINISNFVSTDCLFTALSLIWFTQICWILYKPSRNLLLLHALVLSFAFMVRYNALYFPIFSILAIAVSTGKLKSKIIGIGTIILLIGGFIAETEFANLKEVGKAQFSAFGGWQLAANALYGYAYAQPEEPSYLPTRFHKLQVAVNHHMDSLRTKPAFMRPDNDVGVYYQWNFKSPLRLYVDEVWGKDTLTPYFKRWASMGPLYASYGQYLILHHPIPFVEHYLWPNLIKYYVPPAGFMGSYVSGDTLTEPIAAIWFKWKSNRIYNLLRKKDIGIVKALPPVLGVINLLFALSTIAFLLLGGLAKSPLFLAKLFVWMFLTWLSNLFFSVFSSPIELRYQLFPIIVTLPFLILMLSFLIDECIPSKKQKARPTLSGEIKNQTVQLI